MAQGRIWRRTLANVLMSIALVSPKKCLNVFIWLVWGNDKFGSYYVRAIVVHTRKLMMPSMLWISLLEPILTCAILMIINSRCIHEILMNFFYLVSECFGIERTGQPSIAAATKLDDTIRMVTTSWTSTEVCIVSPLNAPTIRWWGLLTIALTWDSPANSLGRWFYRNRNRRSLPRSLYSNVISEQASLSRGFLALKLYSTLT